METAARPIITVTLNPAVDRTLYFQEFVVGQVNRVVSELADPGGKGINVAKVIQALDCDVTVTGFLGSDNRQIFYDYFTKHHIMNRFIEVPGATRANIKIVDEKRDQVSEINFSGLDCSAEAVIRLEQTLLELASPNQLVVLSGSLPQGVSDDLYGILIGKLQAKGCRVFLDASGHALTEGLKARPFAVKPNLSELSQLTGQEFKCDQDILESMDQILHSGVKEVIVSLGADGAIAANSDERIRVYPPKIKANSTVGAGDSMVAGLIVGEAKGLSLAEKVRLGTAAAAASVARPGTQAGALPDVRKLLNEVIIKKLEV